MPSTAIPDPLTERTANALADFTDNIRSMATGSYLREEDREFWEAPYPVAIVDEADSIVRNLLAAAAGVAARQPEEIARLAADSSVDATLLASSNSDSADDKTEVKTPADISAVDSQQAQATVLAAAIAGVITPKVEELQQLSDGVEGALLDEEEINDLKSVLTAAAEDLGANPAVLVGHLEQLLEN